jgi:hypothetical protein
MSFLIPLLLYLFCGLIGFCAIKLFIKVILELEWTKSDDLVFLWTALSLGWFALIGFYLWIGCVSINELLRKVHLNVY